MADDILETFFQYLLQTKREPANAIIDEWAKERSYREAVFKILEPALVRFGEKWSTEEDVSLAQGYIAAKIAEDIMTKAAMERPMDVEPESKGPVVIGNIEDDYHALGRKLVVIFLRSAGWKVYDLGNDVIAGDLIDKAVQVGAKVVGASAMMYTTAVNVKKLRKEIDSRGLSGRVKLAVGGAVFNLRPELVGEVGGDGTARNALAVPELMERLYDEASKG